jgi:hypothetical protein
MPSRTTQVNHKPQQPRRHTNDMMATGMGLPTPLFQTRARPPKRPLTKEEDAVILYAFETLDVEHGGWVTPKQLKVTFTPANQGAP